MTAGAAKEIEDRDVVQQSEDWRVLARVNQSRKPPGPSRKTRASPRSLFSMLRRLTNNAQD